MLKNVSFCLSIQSEVQRGVLFSMSDCMGFKCLFSPDIEYEIIEKFQLAAL